MASKVEICNLALVQVGDVQLTSLTENTKGARIMSLLWGPTLEDVLRDHTWRFARKRSSLSRLVERPAYQWDYYYQLPSDYIRMVCLGEPNEELLWEIEEDRLATNETEANILYIRMVTDPGRFDPKFVTALSLQLALRAASALTGISSARKDELQKAYSTIILDAETIDSQEAPGPVYTANRWVDARY